VEDPSTINKRETSRDLLVGPFALLIKPYARMQAWLDSGVVISLFQTNKVLKLFCFIQV
jgi:hypothetical protein